MTRIIPEHFMWGILFVFSAGTSGCFGDLNMSPPDTAGDTDSLPDKGTDDPADTGGADTGPVDTTPDDTGIEDTSPPDSDTGTDTHVLIIPTAGYGIISGGGQVESSTFKLRIAIGGISPTGTVQNENQKLQIGLGHTANQ